VSDKQRCAEADRPHIGSSASDDRSGEFCAANGRFGDLAANTGYWSMAGAAICEADSTLLTVRLHG